MTGGVAISALADVTDCHVVPRRLTPGFEMRRSGGGMATMYASLALALAAGLRQGPREA